MKILFIKGDITTNVRLYKYLKFFQSKDISVSYWGWNRNKTTTSSTDFDELVYLLKGGGFGGKKLLLYYPFWMLKVFFHTLFSKSIKGYEIIAVNFDAALPVYIASKIRKLTYMYEIRDEFALSYGFRPFIKRIIQKIDHTIMRNSKLVIHVDANRVTYENCKWVIIENTPEDIFNGKHRNYDDIKKEFAVTGRFSDQRGLKSIFEFAKNNPNMKFLVVGDFASKEDERRFEGLPNVKHYGFMPQSELFKKMEHCCAIFSLYDPRVEINRLAASNKVYDAMMFGIPVITNKEVVNSKFVEDNDLGFVVDYEYNETWDCLSETNLLQKVKEKGTRGRDLYLKQYQFSELIQQRLLPQLISKD